MSDENAEYVINCENLVKIYKTSEIEVIALQGLDLTVEYGELMAIIGNSGSGKSTLLNMIGGLDRPSAGKLFVDGKDLFKLNEKQMVDYRKNTVAFVWQNNGKNLIPYLTAKENIEFIMGYNDKKHIYTSDELLDMVGLSKRKNNKLVQLSGGEQQRVAIAIALCNNPRLLLADEPTGAVDVKTSGIILDLFKEINRNLKITVVIVTHDRQLSKKVDRVVAIRDGRTSSEFIRKKSYVESLKEIEIDTTGINENSHDELVVVDKAGRLQIPKEYLEAIGIKEKGKVKVELEGNKIMILNSNIK